MSIDRERLCELILNATVIQVVVAKSQPGDTKDEIHHGRLNDFLVLDDGTLELWHNTEI